MKKRKMKLALKKLQISNMQNLHSLKGGNNQTSAFIYCVDICLNSEGNVGLCEATGNCETQGGYICGETIGLNCGFRTYEFHNCDTYTNNQYC